MRRGHALFTRVGMSENKRAARWLQTPGTAERANLCEQPQPLLKTLSFIIRKKEETCSLMSNLLRLSY